MSRVYVSQSEAEGVFCIGWNGWDMHITDDDARQLRDELARVLEAADPEASKPLPWPSLNPPRSKP